MIQDLVQTNHTLKALLILKTINRIITLQLTIRMLLKVIIITIHKTIINHPMPHQTIINHITHRMLIKHIIISNTINLNNKQVLINLTTLMTIIIQIKLTIILINLQTIIINLVTKLTISKINDCLQFNIQVTKISIIFRCCSNIIRLNRDVNIILCSQYKDVE